MSARVGLVMLTWDDAELLAGCLPSLAKTAEPFELCVVDNGSTDSGSRLIAEYFHGTPFYVPLGATESDHFKQSLAQALNVGFGHFLKRDDLDFIGWVHPDHIFEQPQWLGELVRVLDEHPEIVKLGAADPDCPGDLRPGNSQCYLVRRTALQQVGLFDEGYLACGGYEDWDHNRRLLDVSEVMITPDALVRHKAMQTRQRHDNTEAGRLNADLYHHKWGTWEPPC